MMNIVVNSESMASEHIFTNATVVTRDRAFIGTLRVAGGMIRDVDDGRSSLPQAVDCDGDFLIPGLVDIHTDNLEKHLEPRPGVKWPGLAAFQVHDRMLATAGVTTVFDSLVIGDMHLGKPGRQGALDLAKDVLATSVDDDLMKADHRLHIRAEVASDTVMNDLANIIDHPLVALVSVMDHTPGQRQWRDLDKWKRMYSRVYTADELDAQIDGLIERQKNYSAQNRQAVIEECRARGIPLASHDDTTAEHVAQGHREGILISEFPTTLDAARAAHAHGMKTIMGSPNVVKGGSHSGNVAAAALAEAGLLDGLASDYVPISMIHSAFILAENHGIPLPDAVAMVTAGPAAMVGLTDRGELAPGKRADLVRVKPYRSLPSIMGVWCRGRQVA
jgi:alpha-D-ribose 1-methylphosphonate 5-triphosphate diphosphatase